MEFENISHNPLANELTQVIRSKLVRPYFELTRLAEKLNRGLLSRQKVVIPSDLEELWQASDQLKVNPDIVKKTVSSDTSGYMGEIFPYQKVAFDTIIYFKSIAPKLLEQSLTQYPYHAPQVSVYVAFLKLFGLLQDDINRLTRKHLDYFYKEVLKQTPLPSQPDKVHVHFDLSDHVLSKMLTSGTQLTAGVDEDGYDYLYITDHDVQLSQAKICDLRVVHVAQNPSVGLGTIFKSVSNIYSQVVNLGEDGEAHDQHGNPTPFFTLGRDQTDISWENREMQPARIGFAISSHILMLREGQREILVTFKFNLKSLSSLVSFIEEVSEKDHVTAESAFNTILGNVLKARFTSEEEWFVISDFEISPPDKWTEGEFTLTINLDISDPPVTRYNEETHGQGFKSDWPVIEFVLSTENAMYGYTYLRDLIIEECHIKVHVNNVKDLQIFNDIGKLEVNKPFFPFGALPEPGSYFLSWQRRGFWQESD